jgi:sarcosine reductase
VQSLRGLRDDRIGLHLASENNDGGGVSFGDGIEVVNRNNSLWRSTQPWFTRSAAGHEFELILWRVLSQSSRESAEDERTVKEIAMRLQLNIVDIKEIRYSEKTMVSNGELLINRSELQTLLQEDKRFKRVEIELARPGEKCRIVHVCDVVEPRAKIGGTGVDFPGVLGRRVTAGQGTTCVLRGSAVVASLFTEGVEGPRDPNGEIIDMSGPAAEWSPYGRTQNVVLLPYPADGVVQQDYRVAIKQAGVKTALYLAKAGQEVKPDETVVYGLPGLVGKGYDGRALPRIAYIFQVLSIQHGVIPREPVLYGLNVHKLLPTIIHPNEVLDGALISPFRAWGMETYSIQNHAVIRELFRRHGKELQFVGVILTIASDDEHENERSAIMAANLAKWVLRADGAVLTKSGGGAPEVPMALVAQQCEHLGIKTTLGLWHIPTDVKDIKGGVTMFNMRELDAIVSMGTPWQWVKLPPMERTIGSPVELPDEPPVLGEMHRMLRWIRGAQDQLGSQSLTAVTH